MREPNFVEVFGVSPKARATASGQVNLMGDPADYNGGFVLPAAVPLRTRVDLAPRGDDIVHVCSSSVKGASSFYYRLGREGRVRSWGDYVQGVTSTLRKLGMPLGGFNALIESTIPPGVGLSSSAALEVSLLRVLRRTFGLALDDIGLARCARAAETAFVGTPVGVMDPMAVSFGRDGEALLLDTRSLAFDTVGLPDDVEILVFDVGEANDAAVGDGGARRDECMSAARHLGVHELRDIDLSRLAEVDRLPEPLNRRARHVINENVRVPRTAAALVARNGRAIADVFADAYASLRDDFEVSDPRLDRVVEIATEDPDILCARPTTNSSGACIVALARRGSSAGYRLVSRAGRGTRLLVPDTRS